MSSVFVLALAGALVGHVSAAAAASAQLTVEGVWRSVSGTEVSIRACKEGYCGYISKIVVPERIRTQYGTALDDVDPSQYFDQNNPDPALRGRTIQGLQILTMQPTDEPGVYTGEIYNPEDGNTYAGSLFLRGPQQVRLRGCALLVFCRDEDWIRVGPPEAAW